MRCDEPDRQPIKTMLLAGEEEHIGDLAKSISEIGPKSVSKISPKSISKL
jgi:hypothetical protein